MKGQSRMASFVEAWIGVAVGFGVNFLIQLLVFPGFGFNVTIRQSLEIGAIFTVVSVIRSYTLRRVFEFFTRRGA